MAGRAGDRLLSCVLPGAARRVVIPIYYLIPRRFKLGRDGLAHLAEPLLDHRDEQVRAAAQLRVLAVRLDRDLLDLCINRLPRTVNGTGHTGPSEFCATSI